MKRSSSHSKRFIDSLTDVEHNCSPFYTCIVLGSPSDVIYRELVTGGPIICVLVKGCQFSRQKIQLSAYACMPSDQTDARPYVSKSYKSFYISAIDSCSR
jgi:hypothetical protein